MIHSDIILIGAGIVGTSLARALSRFRADILVLERGADLAEGATKANSGIVHAGYDALPGSRKAYYNVKGAAMYPSLCAALSVPYRKCGALVVGFDDRDRETLETLLRRGIVNGVSGLEIVDRSRALAMEPNLNPEVTCALVVPESGIVSPYEMAYALADDAAVNGVRFLFGKEVSSIRRGSDGSWQIAASDGQCFSCSVLVNCSGASGAVLHHLYSADPLRMIHRRGQYYLLDRSPALPFQRTIFQCPSPLGKGVLVTPTVHGNMLLGPNAEDIEDPLDTATTAEGLSFVLKKAARTWPAVPVRANITNFSGVRAHLENDDFIIGAVPGAPGIFEAIGIESPGLSSAPAIAEDLSAEIAQYLSLQRREKTMSFPPLPKPFHDMSSKEREEAVRSDPAYGNIVCRCEMITEAEIRQAIRRPVGAVTIDGIKRRTRAGMGRCQGGFCSPRVAQILCEETGTPMEQVTKDGGAGMLLAGTVESFLKGET